jgi:hypothetical protein
MNTFKSSSGLIESSERTDMGIPYNEFKYLYPPRPEFILSWDRIPYYEKLGWIGQYKKNGTCTILAVGPQDGDTAVIAMGRHAEDHKAWKLNDYLREKLIELLPENSWTVLIAEVMHSKTPTIKDTLYIHDLVVHKSEFLMGSTFKSRQQILDKILPVEDETYSHYVVDHKNKLWRAKNITEDILGHFQRIKDTRIDEGIVLKDPTGKLKPCDKSDSNKSWQAKVRHPHKNYSF